MRNLLTVLIFSFILMGCSGLKKEITRLTDESKSKTEFYEKKIYELNTKISETESREAKSKTDLEIKKSEIATLKKERSQIQEQLDKKDRTDFSIDNPNGFVKVTDAKGNSYEFEGGTGTKISNTSESTLSTKLQSVTESLSRETEKTESLTKKVTAKNNIIKKKDTEISEKSQENKKLLAQVKTLNESLAKSILKTGIPAYVWVVAGMFLLGLIQLLWKIYRPKIKF